MKRKVTKPQVRLNKKKVEDGILTYLQGGTPTTDVEFGETHVKFSDRKQYDRALGFRTFKINNVSYTLATKDEAKMTITYLFH